MKYLLLLSLFLAFPGCAQLPVPGTTPQPTVTIAKIESVLSCMRGAHKTPSNTSRAALTEVEQTLEKIELAQTKADAAALTKLKAAAGRFDSDQKSTCNSF
jgi:hypothetical protein